MIEKYFINPEDTLFLIIDIQEKLVKAMEEKIAKMVIRNTVNLIETAKLFNIPILITEQYPQGLGETVREIKNALPSYTPIEKITFSSLGEPKFEEKLLEYPTRKKIILTGMETHVCIWQTSVDLLKKGFIIFIPKDAVCSRKKIDWETSLDLINSVGGIITTTETLIFQILKKAGTPEFKKIINYLK